MQKFTNSIIFLFTVYITLIFVYGTDNELAYHRLVKRAVVEKKLSDPGNCVQTCSLAQSSPDVQKKASAFTNPTLRACFLHGILTTCINKCGDSEAKKYMSTAYAPLDATCLSYDEDAVNCMRGKNGVDVSKPCFDKCGRYSSAFLNIAFNSDPISRHLVSVTYDNDAAKNKKDLVSACKNVTCALNCVGPIAQKRCGPKAAEFAKQQGQAALQYQYNMMVLLKLIDSPPTECKSHVKANAL